MVLLCLPFNEICEAGVKGYDIDEEEVDIFMKFHVKKVANWRSEATFWQSNLWQWEEKKIAQQDGSIDRISTLHFIFQSQKDHNNIDDVGCCCTCLKNLSLVCVFSTKTLTEAGFCQLRLTVQYSYLFY